LIAFQGAFNKFQDCSSQ